MLISLAMMLALTPLHIYRGDNVADDISRPYEYCPISGTLPFNFYAYVCGGQRLLEGKTVYANYSVHKSEYRGLPYGPGVPLVFASVIGFAGADFAALKVPAIVFTAVMTLLVFLITEHLFGTRRGNIVAILWAFSYYAMINSGLFASTDQFFLVFTFLAAYLAFKGRWWLSAAAMGAGMFFKLSVILFLPPMIYYIYLKGGVRWVAVYGLVFSLVFLACLAPFWEREGAAILYPYNSAQVMKIDGWGLMNLLRLGYGLPYHALHPTLLLRENDPSDPMTYEGTNPFSRLLRALELPFNIIAFVMAAYYALRHRMRNHDLELVRNTVLFIVTMMIFLKTFHDMYIIWFMPYAFILLSKEVSEPGRREAAGAVLVFIGVLIYAGVWTTALYRQLAEHLWIWASFILVMAGSYMAYRAFGRRRQLILSAVTLLPAYSNMMGSLPFIIFYPVVQGHMGLDAFRQLTYYVGFFVMLLYALAALYILLREVHLETSSEN
jgi:hypothetical protein